MIRQSEVFEAGVGRRRGAAAVLAAAGRGERLGAAGGDRGSKAFVELGGRPLAWHALASLQACPEIEEIVLVVAPGEVERARRVLVGAEPRRTTTKVVAGGEQRQESVRAGLAEVGAGYEFVVVHDAARPFLRPPLVRRCLEAAAQHGAAVAALPATDTVKQVSAEGAVVGTLDRSPQMAGRSDALGLWLVQTPQVFRSQLLREAHEAAAQERFLATDDAALVERLGRPVHVVLGDPRNTKITYPQDLAWAEERLADLAWAEERLRASMSRSENSSGREAVWRSGIGYDAHPFAGELTASESRPLFLAGVRFEGERGLLGHSDADVVCHAICDAVLGAAGAGDIGQYFPDSDSRWAGASSLSLLARAAEIARNRGWEIGNVDAVVIAEAPRIAGRREEMRRALAEALGIGMEQVNVKGKTAEGMGFVGRREGIASQAVALLWAPRGGQTGLEAEGK